MDGPPPIHASTHPVVTRVRYMRKWRRGTAPLPATGLLSNDSSHSVSDFATHWLFLAAIDCLGVSKYWVSHFVSRRSVEFVGFGAWRVFCNWCVNLSGRR